jgi:hypothetical protein
MNPESARELEAHVHDSPRWLRPFPMYFEKIVVAIPKYPDGACRDLVSEGCVVYVRVSTDVAGT